MYFFSYKKGRVYFEKFETGRMECNSEAEGRTVTTECGNGRVVS